jgi:hypothetical protein
MLLSVLLVKSQYYCMKGTGHSIFKFQVDFLIMIMSMVPIAKVDLDDAAEYW